MTHLEPNPTDPRDVFAAISGGRNIERASRITLALTLAIVSFPWLVALLLREDPWGPRHYAPVPNDVALLLVRIMPVVAALAGLVGTGIAAARASTAPGRVVACMGGAVAIFVLPVVALVAGDSWGRAFVNDEDGGVGPVAVIGGIGTAILLGIPLSLLRVWALDAERQPSIDRLWRYGRRAGVLVAVLLGAHAALEMCAFGNEMMIGAVHGVASCGALIAASIFSERVRRMRLWLGAVRAGSVSGWRVRELRASEEITYPLVPFIAGDGTDAVLEMLDDDSTLEPYRSGPPHGEPVAFVSG